MILRLLSLLCLWLGLLFPVSILGSLSGNRTAGGGGAEIWTVNGLDQATGRTLGQRRYGVTGSVAPGATVRVKHPGAPNGEDVSVDPVTGAYSASWIATSPGSVVERVEMLVRGTLAGAGTNGTDAVADKLVWSVVPAASEVLDYDGAGRLVGDNLWTYTWDARGKLTGMTRKAGTFSEPSITSEELSFRYDAEGRRVRKLHTVTYQNASTKMSESKLLWNGWLPAMEDRTVDGVAQPRRWFVWGRDQSDTWNSAGGIGGLAAIIEEGGRTLLPVDDGLGNIMAVVNAADGSVVATYDYGPYGEPLSRSGEVSACPFRYQSKYLDVETGLSYFGYRYYSAKLGRWISRDPLGESGGFNLYAYCGNDPVNKWDYLGLDAASDVWAEYMFPNGDPQTAKLRNISQTQLKNTIISKYVTEAVLGRTSAVAASNEAETVFNTIYSPAWQAARLEGAQAVDRYNKAMDDFYSPGGSFVAGLPNRLKAEGSEVLAFTSTMLLSSEAQGYRIVAGAKFDPNQGKFVVKWGFEDVTPQEQALAAGLFVVGGFADDFLRLGRVGLAAKFGEYGDEAVDVYRLSRAGGAKKTVDLYRAVGVREYEGVMGTGKFLPGANSLEGRQFAHTLEEALKYADTDPTKAAILKVTVPKDVLPAFDFSKAIDPHIFKNGVITVQPGVQSELFHKSLIGPVIHAY